MVNENSWEDIQMEQEVTAPMKKLSLKKNFPNEYRQSQGTIGHTDTDGNIQKLNKLAHHPECFSFLPHDTFINEDDLKAQIEREGP